MNSTGVTEELKVALKEVVDVVIWSQKPFGDLSEAMEVIEEDDKDVKEVV